MQSMTKLIISFTSILSIISSSSNTGSTHFRKSILCSAANIHINTSQYGKRGLSLTSGQSQSKKQGQGQGQGQAQAQAQVKIDFHDFQSVKTVNEKNEND
jgi:hypothetical protein